jgi:HPt (histidine-containing phosphotransfer) domain-containing protein
MCQTELPKQVAEVVSALEAKDALSLRAAAHKLKGAALALEADPLAEVAERMQHAAEHEALDLCDELRTSLQRCLADVQRALSSELERSAG